MLKKLWLRQKNGFLQKKKRKRAVARAYFVDFVVLLMSFERIRKNKKT